MSVSGRSDQPQKIEVVNSGVANPVPLGIGGFALTTTYLGLVSSGAIGGSGFDAVLPLALLYGGLAQLLAGMWEFKNKNIFGATAFSSYGAFWIAFYVLVRWWLPGLSAGAAHEALGFFLVMWGIFTFYMWIASFKTNVAVWLVFLTLWLAYAILAAGELGGDAGTYGMIYEAGGYITTVCGVIAWYVSFAEVTNGTWGRVVIPLGPLNQGGLAGARKLGSAATVAH
ncbi:MAG: acetate uptake transporter [Acidimicrobiales bacterium]